MKQIKAFLRPQMLDAVVDAVGKLPGAPGLTVSTLGACARYVRRGL